jgi:hypothetical protein
MSPPNDDLSAQLEARINLAMQAIDSGRFRSARGAAAAYSVSKDTLSRRAEGIPSRRDCIPKSKKLTEVEESVLVQHILELDSRGFSPRLIAVRDMANKLLAERGAGKVGVLWPHNFVTRTPELKTRFNRKYDYQRAKCEDPELIKGWFELVRNTKAKHGITDDDIYNFDETGFQMGVIMSGMVVTASERRGRPKAVQPGNKEWTTVIQGVNARGWAIPPFVIFAGTYLLEAWFEEEAIPGDWTISVSDAGWTTNMLGLEWIQHFHKHTKDRTTGAKRLLIVDGHDSHETMEFKDFCKEHGIITLCMPAHSSHLLQPLDVGCFSPLKRAYGHEVEALIRNHINHVTKLEFLPAFKAAFEAAFTSDNIRGGFRGAGLLPFDPEAVLSQLDVRLRTPSPPPAEEAHWESKTPSNSAELASQTTLIQRKMAAHQNSSPTAINEALDQLAKGAQMMSASATLLRAQVAELQKANELATRRRRRQKRRVQREGTLTIAEGQDIISQRSIEQQLQVEMRESRARGGTGPPKQRRCGRCREPGHRIETCPLNRQTTVE